MRQNPITARLQVGGRSMPSWFSASLVRDTVSSNNGSRRSNGGMNQQQFSQQLAQQPPPVPPPPPAVPPPVESEYEDIDNLPRYSNTNSKPVSGKKSCSLCGNPSPVVRCEMCNNQIFCGSCNDMYHRHPKRHKHVRTILEIVDNRPPLPPKVAAPPDAPIPPPRRRQKFGGIRSATSSPTMFRKGMFPSDPMGSLRRQPPSSSMMMVMSGMEQRPLPPPPQPPPPLPPKVDRRHSSPAPPANLNIRGFAPGRNIPTTVQEMGDRRQRPHFNRQPSWDDIGRNMVPEGRSGPQSMSTTQLNRFNSSSNLSHIATLQRKPKKPIICGPVRQPPPPLPQRSYPQPQQTPPPPPHRPYPQYPQQYPPYPHQSMHSASAFNLNDDPRMMPQWPYPYQFFDQQPPDHPFFYPGSTASLKRTPSTSSMTNQPVFNPWSTIRLAQTQPLTASERELEIINSSSSRRGSEPPPPYGNAPPPPLRPRSSMNQHAPSSPFLHHHHQQQHHHHHQREFEAEPRPRAFSVHNNWGPPHLSDSHNSRSDDNESSKEPSSAGPPDGFWTCEWCTLLNSCDTRICNACAKSRNVEEQNQTEDSDDRRHEDSDRRSVRGSSKSRGGHGVARKKTPAVVRSTLSFSRNDNKTQVERQVIKVDACSDEDLAGETSSSESQDEGPPEGFKFITKAKTPLTSSNEEVYGSVRIQSLTIGPHRRNEKEATPLKVTTAVGSSPPSHAEFDSLPVHVGKKKSSPLRIEAGTLPVKVESRTSPAKVEFGTSPIKATEFGTSPIRPEEIVTSLIRAAEFGTSPLRVSPVPSNNSSNFQYESSGHDSASKKSSVSSSGSKKIKPALKQQTSVDTYTTTDELHKQIEDFEKTKTSKGTSPPPQSISTQTYEELPIPKLESKSVSRSSMLDGSMLDEPLVMPRKPNEISDKELRYSRRAQQQSKLKRSMSTHLTSAAEPWENEGRALYRSSSRHSLASEPRYPFQSLPISGPPSRDASPPPHYRKYYQDSRMYRPPSWDRLPSPGDYFASIEDLVRARMKDSRSNEFELTRLLKDAAEFGYSPEDVQVALRMCGERNPIKWLQDNWNTMVETVQTLASKYGREKGDESNDVGTVSIAEAKDALRQHRGNVWVAVTECVEQRRKKFQELQSRGTFLREDILTALTANHGKLDAAYVELSKAQLKPFLMQIWGPPIGLDNDTAPSPRVQSVVGSTSSGSTGKDDELLEPSHVEEPQAEIVELEAENMEDLVQDDALLSAAHLEEKRGSIEDESFVDAPEDSTLEQKDKEVIEASSDLEESEAFVSDLLQNFQISPTAPKTPSPSPKLPKESEKQQESPPALGPAPLKNQPEEIEHAAPKNLAQTNASTNSTNEVTTASSASTAASSSTAPASSSALQTLVGSSTMNPAPLQFTMEAVLELLEAQRVKFLQEKATSQSPLAPQSPQIIPATNLELAIPEASETLTLQQEFPTAVATSSAQSTYINDTNGNNNSSSNSAIISHQTATRSPIARIELQTQASTDSGDLDPSIYEEVDGGENLSMSEYIPRNSEEDDDEDMSEDGESEGSAGSTEDDEDGSIDRSDDDLIDEIYERIEPLDSDNIDGAISIKKSPTIGLKEDLQNETVAAAALPDLTLNLKPEIKRLLDIGSCNSIEHAELAVQLMDMKFPEEDAVHAAKECSSIYTALSYLQQECLLCASKFSVSQMVSMLRCTHWCCKTCTREYFMVQLRDHGILDATCPFCKEPSNLMDDPDAAAEYFNHLDIMLKSILDYKHHEMFQRKLRDWALSKTPNFKWCSKCSSGFITEPLQTRLVCPDCSAVTCAVCLEPWDRTHDHRDQNLVKLCDATKSVVEYLNENCVECPRCRLKFALARGGCMHLTCSQCKFEYCSGCSAPFRLANKCNEGPFCLKLGLHAHHPRNCLFYLRDKDAADLAKLLQEHAIPYLSEEIPDGTADGDKRVCRVSIQRETETGLHDDICGNEAPAGFANVCQGHYIEYLGLLIWQNRLDPVSVLSNDDLETIIKRAHKKVPARIYGTKDADFRVKLLQVIKDDIAL